jgi:DNA-binding CsgD family transcriptional regulator
MGATPMVSLSPSAVSDLIGEIYECIIEPARWAEALTAMRSHLDYATAAMSVLSLQEDTQILGVVSGIEEPWLSRMGDYRADVIEQWGGPEALLNIPFDSPAVLSWVNPAGADPRLSRYAREWGVPQGLIDTLAVGLDRNGLAVSSLGMGRHTDAGPITRIDVDNAKLFIPHLRRAVAVSRLFEIQAMEKRNLEASLDRLASPVFLVSPSGALIYTNFTGNQVLDAGAPLALRGGRLSGSTAALKAEIELLIESLRLGNRAICDRTGFGIGVRMSDGSPAALHVLPLAHGSIRLPGAIAAIFLSPPVTKMTGGELIAKLFTLTAAEIKIFDLLAAGKTVNEISYLQGVERSTVRTHLIHLFEKLGVHRQTDLVRMASTLQSPLILESKRISDFKEY